MLWPPCPMQATTQSIYQASTVALNTECSGSATSHFFGTTLPYWPRSTHSNSSLALFRLGERENGTRASKRLSTPTAPPSRKRTRERVPFQWAMTQNISDWIVWSSKGRPPTQPSAVSTSSLNFLRDYSLQRQTG